METQEYNTLIGNMSDPVYLTIWKNLTKEYQAASESYKAHDPQMTLILRGMVKQINELTDHVTKKKDQIDKAELKAKEEVESLIIDSEPEITVEPETTTTSEVKE